MEMLTTLSNYFPMSVFTGKCLVFISEEYRVELTEHTSMDFSGAKPVPAFIRVKVFRNETGKFKQTHIEDFQFAEPGVLAERIERYVQLAINRNIREMI